MSLPFSPSGGSWGCHALFLQAPALPRFFGGIFRVQVHFPPLRMMLAKRGRDAATTSQAAESACWALKQKHPVVAKSVASRKKHITPGQVC